MSILTAAGFVAGVVMLVAGAEALVRGASRLAAAAGISPLVIGLTVVAFGTSSPELAVSVGAALDGRASLAVGNVVGSNIFNVLFILGVSAVIVPLVVRSQLVRLDVPVMIAASVVVLLLGLNGRIGRGEGSALFGALVLYLAYLVVLGRRQGEGRETGGLPERPTTKVDLVLVAGGLGMLVAGSRLLVNAAVDVAMAIGVSELVIGLTVVAAGTSLPEVATSVLAAVRGHREIAVGNVVGSNIFNLLGVLGITAALAPGGVPVAAATLRFDLPVMTAVALACLPVFFTGQIIARWEGALFLGYYAAYTAYLILDASGHDTQPVFGAVMMAFVVPVTVLTLALTLWRAMRHREARPR